MMILEMMSQEQQYEQINLQELGRLADRPLLKTTQNTHSAERMCTDVNTKHGDRYYETVATQFTNSQASQSSSSSEDNKTH